MEQNILEIAKEFCRRKGLPLPLTVIGAQDDLTVQIWGLMNEGIQDIASRYNHQQLQIATTFQHANGPGYLAYDLSGLLNFRNIVPQTLWATTTRLPVRGPLSQVEWTTLTSMLVAQSLYSYIQFGNAIHIFGVPSPTTAETFGFMFQSRYGVASSLGFLQASYSDDTDVPLLPQELILADLKWRYAAAKGLPYAEDQRISEQMLTNAVGGNDQGVLVMDGDDYFGGFPPGVIVPSGNWNV